MHPHRKSQRVRRGALEAALLLALAGAALPLSATIDRCGDGVSEIWRALHPAAGAPAIDTDGDGVPTLAESVAGTDPLAAASRFAAAPRLDPSGNLTLTWSSVTGKRYRFESSSDLRTWTAETALGELAGIGTTLTQTVRTAGTAAPSFWRVVVADTDTDADGLNDWEEARLGTSPTASDTDHDGLPDAWEATYGTNPTVADATADPDNDGRDNLTEYRLGGHPNRPDAHSALAGDPGIEAQRNPQPVHVYYVDAVFGADTAIGTTRATAWRTLARLAKQALVPGDVVRFARGSVWGPLKVTANGTATAPIVFEAYGAGEAPTFESPDSMPSRQLPAIWVLGSWVRILELRLRHVYGTALELDSLSEGIVAGGCEITLAGSGISLKGSHHKVLSNYIHDLHMIRNTPKEWGLIAGTPGWVKDNDDYGAVGVWFLGQDLEIAWNRVEDCRQPSYDYGVDGGAFELIGPTADVSIHHNWTRATDGFLEANSTTGHVTNLVIAYNVFLAESTEWSPVFTGFHMESKAWGSHNYDARIENNTVICENPKANNSGILGFWTDKDVSASRFTVRNNIFITAYTILWNPQRLLAGFTHENNRYAFLGTGKLGALTLGPGESVVSLDSLFVDLTTRNLRLRPGSPALNAGAAAGYSTDVLGTAVPTGTAPDIGAYEAP